MRWMILTVSLVFTCITAQSQETTTFNCCVPSSSSSYDGGEYYSDYKNCINYTQSGEYYMWSGSSACCSGSDCTDPANPPCCGNSAYSNLTVVCNCPYTCYQGTSETLTLTCQDDYSQYNCTTPNDYRGQCCSTSTQNGGAGCIATNDEDLA